MSEQRDSQNATTIYSVDYVHHLLAERDRLAEQVTAVEAEVYVERQIAIGYEKERDAALARVKDLEQERMNDTIRVERIPDPNALAHVATLREALEKLCARYSGLLTEHFRLSGSREDEVKDEVQHFLCTTDNSWGEAQKAMSATADAGKWLSEHDDAVRAEVEGCMHELLRQSHAMAVNDFYRGLHQGHENARVTIANIRAEALSGPTVGGTSTGQPRPEVRLWSLEEVEQAVAEERDACAKAMQELTDMPAAELHRARGKK